MHLLTASTLAVTAVGKPVQVQRVVSQDYPNPPSGFYGRLPAVLGLLNARGVANADAVMAMMIPPPAAGGPMNTTEAEISNVLTPTLQDRINVRVACMCHTSTNSMQSNPLGVLDALLTITQHPNPLDPGSTGWQYWGCFNSVNYLAVSGRTAENIPPASGMNPRLCIASCVAKGLEVAAVISEKCYCSDDKPTFDDGSDQCTLACPQSTNPKDKCGGTNAISMFRRAVTANPGPLPPVREPTNWRYSGCYYGDAWMTVEPSKVASFSNGLSPGKCTAFCASDANTQWKYAGIYDTYCYCINSAPSAVGGIGQCGKACPGTADQACGGENKNVFYQSSTKSTLVSLYVRAPVAVSSAPASPNAGDSIGCYYGALYLLNTLLSGTQVSATTDTTNFPTMSGARCLTYCLDATLNKKKSFPYAMTLGATCFCHANPPSKDISVSNQATCNEPCFLNTNERCGGNDVSYPATLGGSLVNVFARNPVSGFRFIRGLYMWSKLCSVLCFLLDVCVVLKMVLAVWQSYAVMMFHRWT